MHDMRLKNTDGGGPGPSVYYLKPTIGMPKKTDPTLWQSPAYSFRPRTNIPNDSHPSPGPEYKFDRMTRYGRDTNGKIIFGSRLPDSNKANTIGPGPAIYLPCYPNLIHAPTPKILFPLKELNKFITPSPNAYTLRKPDDTSSSIKSRRKGYTIQWKTRCPFGETGTASPGPAAYGPPNADAYKNRAPAVTMGARVPCRVRPGPGPQTYHVSDAECARGCARKFSFGVKHSPKSPPYLVPDDNRSP